MPLQKHQVFLLKSSDPMVFDLIWHGMNGFWQLGDTHTESAITLLPTKVVQLSKSLMNPGRIRKHIVVTLLSHAPNLGRPAGTGLFSS